MKKLIATLMIAGSLLTLASCNKDKKTDDASTPDTDTSTSQGTSAE